MSIFLVHQTPARAIMLADSLASREHSRGAGPFSIQTSKLLNVGAGVFAAHAGTWQPAIAMLSELSRFLRRTSNRTPPHKALLTKLRAIGEKQNAEFSKRFKGVDFDIRIALILTGKLRDPIDIRDGYSSTLVIWEKARRFSPHRSRGHIYFAGNPELSSFATTTLEHPLLKDMLRSTSLAAAQALIATHAALARVSSFISEDSNVLVVANESEHALLKGSMHALPCEALLEG